MELKVTLPGMVELDDPEECEITVRSFRDVVRIGAAVARAVRDWLRQVPMTPHVKQKNFYISAEWVEGTSNPGKPDLAAEPSRSKRKRKAKK